MKQRVGMILLVAALSWTGSASAGLVDFIGYSWESGGFPPSDKGDRLSVVGTVTGLSDPLSWSPATAQYTYYMHGLVSEGQLADGDDTLLITYSKGQFDVFEENEFDADYGLFPPNDVAPSSFADGELYARFRLSEIRIFYNEQFQSGAFEGTVVVGSGGSHDEELDEFRDGLTFGGLFNFGVPGGYDVQWTGEIILMPIPVTATTWGAVKSTFAH